MNIIELIDRRKRLNSIWPWLLFLFNWHCWRTYVSCHAVPGSPVIPYVNLYFWGIFLLGSSSKDDVEDWEDIIWKCLFEGIGGDKRRQPQNRSFHVVDGTRTALKCTKMKNALAKHTKLLFFTIKYANVWRSCRRPGYLIGSFSIDEGKLQR